MYAISQFSLSALKLGSSCCLQVRWWDVTVGKQDFRLDGHSDYVRAAAVSPTSPDTWATAGYDHICKLWDVRSQECVMNLDHGAPIEDVKFFPSGIRCGQLAYTVRRLHSAAQEEDAAADMA